MINFPSACPQTYPCLTASCPLTIDIAAAIDRQRCNSRYLVLVGGRGGWTCAISCPVANGTRRFRTFEMGWFCPLVDHAAVWKKGGVESVSFCDVDGWLSWKVRGNELMGVLWVKRIILGGSFDPSSSFFLFQKVFGGWSPKWWLFDWK